MDTAEFRARLGMELTTMDSRDSRRKGWNPWALPQYLAAADEVATMIGRGSSAEQAFSYYFTPTRGIHGVARRLGLALAVDRGQWKETT